MKTYKFLCGWAGAKNHIHINKEDANLLLQLIAMRYEINIHNYYYKY